MKDDYSHIVHIITRLDLGGAQRVCLLLLDGIKKDGGSVSLISGTGGELAPVALEKFDSVFLLDSFKHKISPKNILCEFKAFFDVWRVLRKLKKKHKKIIVHTHTPKAGIIGRVAAFFAGSDKIVHTVHGLSFNKYQPWYLRTGIKFVEWFVGLFTTHFICVSQSDQNICSTVHFNFLNKSSVIYPAVNWRQLLPARKADDFLFEDAMLKKDAKQKKKIVIGCVSCFKPLKNLIDLFVSFKNLNNKVGDKFDLVLEVAGEGKMRPIYEEWVVKNGMQDKILLLGWRHDTAKLMEQWDIFAMSSLKEGLPCAIVEARFAKLPVVAYSVDGVPEIIRHEVNGLLALPKDVETFSNNLHRLVEDESLRLRLAQDNDFLDRFQDDYMNKEHLKLYKGL